MRALVLVAGVALVAGGCAESLPDQDRRITVAIAVVKLSADDLWKDYHADPAAADRTYHGKAVEVSGNVSEFTRNRTADGYVLFEQQKPHGVRAYLLDDQAAGILASLKEGQRITLKCFCDGMRGDVVLKSCIRAQH